jgi:hypothetical protein
MELIEYKDMRLFSLQSTEGSLGDFPSWDCDIFETTEELYKSENEFIQKYPLTEVPRTTLKVTITIASAYLQAQKLSSTKLTSWIQRAIAYTCFNIGAGVLDDMKLKVTKGDTFNTYHSEIEIIYTPTLAEILVEYMIIWGIDFSNPLNAIKIE